MFKHHTCLFAHSVQTMLNKIQTISLTYIFLLTTKCLEKFAVKIMFYMKLKFHSHYLIDASTVKHKNILSSLDTDLQKR